MNKGMISQIIITTFLLCVSAGAAAQIFKTVDENGNVVYTDQQPEDGSEPMVLPELSIIETNYPQARTPAEEDAEAASDEPKELTPRELRRLYRDFRITRPTQEETFWGTANTVVVSWGSSSPFQPDMKVALYVNGKAQEAPPAGAVSLRLDRGEHQVYAELRDANNRRIVTTDTVTFFIKQQSVNFNRRGGGG